MRSASDGGHPRELAHEMRAEQAHKAGEANQVDLISAELLGQHAVVDLAI